MVVSKEYKNLSEFLGREEPIKYDFETIDKKTRIGRLAVTTYNGEWC